MDATMRNKGKTEGFQGLKGSPTVQGQPPAGASGDFPEAEKNIFRSRVLEKHFHVFFMSLLSTWAVLLFCVGIIAKAQASLINFHTPHVMQNCGNGLVSIIQAVSLSLCTLDSESTLAAEGSPSTRNGMIMEFIVYFMLHLLLSQHHWLHTTPSFLCWLKALCCTGEKPTK